MLLRAVLAFLALPGVVAFAVPAAFVWNGGLRPAALFEAVPSPGRLLGLILFTVGLAVLLVCVRDFYVAGKGTLAPWAPPRHLVKVGLYRWSRNPMYVGVLMILAGWALAFQLRALWIYAAAVMTAFHLRVVIHEEPFLERTHGDAWLRYKASVPRWIGR